MRTSKCLPFELWFFVVGEIQNDGGEGEFAEAICHERRTQEERLCREFHFNGTVPLLNIAVGIQRGFGVFQVAELIAPLAEGFQFFPTLLPFNLRRTPVALPQSPNFINASPAPSFVPRDVHLPCAPRNITHVRGSLLQIAAFSQLSRCCEMLTGFGFRGEMYYLCNSKEERAHKQRAFSSFCAQKSIVLPRR